MVQGRYKSDFWLRVVLSLLGGLLPLLALLGYVSTALELVALNGFDWIDALRKRVCAGRTISAARVA